MRRSNNNDVITKEKMSDMQSIMPSNADTTIDVHTKAGHENQVQVGQNKQLVEVENMEQTSIKIDNAAKEQEEGSNSNKNTIDKTSSFTIPTSRRRSLIRTRKSRRQKGS